MISQIIWEIGDAADLIWFLGDFSPRNHTILGDLGFYPPPWFLADFSARNHQCELGISCIKTCSPFSCACSLIGVFMSRLRPTWSGTSHRSARSSDAHISVRPPRARCLRLDRGCRQLDLGRSPSPLRLHGTVSRLIFVIPGSDVDSKLNLIKFNLFICFATCLQLQFNLKFEPK